MSQAPNNHVSWNDFVDHCEEENIGNPDELHEDDWLSAWRTWITAYNLGQQNPEEH